jgi:hypothetical protein
MNGVIPFDVGFVAFLVMAVIARIISARASKSLPPEKKAALVDKFSGISAYGMIPLIVIVAVFFLLQRTTQIDGRILLWGYAGSVIVFIVVSQVISVRRLRELSLERAHLRQYTLARIFALTGLCVLILAIVPIGEQGL